MRTLYHFNLSPFSRRARLALAYKGLDAELREARQTPAYMDTVRALNPMRTVPVLVEADGRAISDSTAIVHYLDAAYVDAPPLWPADAAARSRALGVAQLVDGALGTLVDVGTRYYALHGDPAWPSVVHEMVGRAQGALNALGALVEANGPRPLGGERRGEWGAADIWLFTAVTWLDGLPARVSASPNVAQIVSLSWSLPTSLTRWAEAHRTRSDVRALDG